MVTVELSSCWISNCKIRLANIMIDQLGCGTIAKLLKNLQQIRHCTCKKKNNELITQQRNLNICLQFKFCSELHKQLDVQQAWYSLQRISMQLKIMLCRKKNQMLRNVKQDRELQTYYACNICIIWGSYQGIVNEHSQSPHFQSVGQNLQL